MTRVVIVGAGFGGIAAAIELRSAGFNDVTVLEAAPGLGGTWYHNTYPGVACDVPSHLYSFSYAQRGDWPRLCPQQPEILSYLRQVAHEYGVADLVVPDTRVHACTWDDARCRWQVHTGPAQQGPAQPGTVYEADALVLATGQLHQPALPGIPGRDSFAGRSFHSAQWDHGYDLRDKRVAVVGTGASAVQFVPEIAGQVRHLTVFQRTGNWFLPRRNRAYPRALKAAFRRVPGLQRARRRGLFYYLELLTAMIRKPDTVGRIGALRSALFMRRQLGDPGVRRKAWPDYTFGCKRVLFSSHFLPALQRGNVELVTDRVERIEPTGVVTADGRRHEVDCVIYGTGFRTHDFMFPMEVTGTGGRALRDAWATGPHAYLGMSVPGFPSMFLLYGPNTNTSGGSIVFYLEAQARYLRQALELVRDRGAAAVDVRADVEAADDARVQSRFAGTAWTRCDSWYRDDRGRVITNWPGYMREYAARTRTLRPADFHLVWPAPGGWPGSGAGTTPDSVGARGRGPVAG